MNFGKLAIPHGVAAPDQKIEKRKIMIMETALRLLE